MGAAASRPCSTSKKPWREGRPGASQRLRAGACAEVCEPAPAGKAGNEAPPSSECASARSRWNGLSCSPTSSSGPDSYGALGDSPTAASVQPAEPADGLRGGCSGAAPATAAPGSGSDIRSPPRPSCDDTRLQVLRSTLQRASYEGRSVGCGKLLRLASTVLNCELAALLLLDGRRVRVANAVGLPEPGAGADTAELDFSFAGWQLLSPNHEVLIVEDSAEDARLAGTAIGEHFGFLMCAPLISNGHRMGVLCLGGSAPRCVDASAAQVAANLAELLRRELEADRAENQRNRSLALIRSVDAHCEALMFVSARPAPGAWHILHVNERAAAVCGLAHENAAEGYPLWDAFQLLGSPPSKDICTTHAEALRKGREFSIRGVQRRDPAAHSSNIFTMVFRPAAREAVDATAALVGVPSSVASCERGMQQRFGHLWFVSLHDALAHPAAERRSERSALMPRVTPFPGLTLGPLLGRGSYGRVYRGTHLGRPVAVKIIYEAPRMEGDVPLEVAVSQRLTHPGLVRTLAHATAAAAAPAALEPALPTRSSSLPLDGTEFAPPTPRLADRSGAERASLGSSLKRSLLKVSSDLALSREANANPVWGGAAGGAARPGKGGGEAAVGGGSGGGACCDSAGSRELGSGAGCALGDWEDELGALAGDVPAPAPPRPGAFTAAPGETWLMLELCDRGSLQDAVSRGLLRQGPTGKLRGAAVLQTALEIAEACAFLHSHGIVHGDLTGGNVLLTSAPHSAHGFCAKISDFGLSRLMGDCSRVDTDTYGTLTHMPPEVVVSGQMSASADVYSFGVLLYEMITGQRAWAGLSHVQVIMAVGVKGERLELTAETDPPELRELACCCMATEAAARPAFPEVIAALRVMLRGVAAADAAAAAAAAAVELPERRASRRRGCEMARAHRHTVRC